MSTHQTAEPAIPLGLAREIARQGEVRLNAVMALTTAAVARATTLCGVFGAASIALVAAVLAYVATAPHLVVGLILGGAVPSALLFLSAILAGTAGAPRDFWLPGGMPRSLRDAAWSNGHWRSEEEVLDAMAAGLANAIETDRRHLEHESLIVRCSLWLSAVSAPAGILAYFAARLLA